MSGCPAPPSLLFASGSYTDAAIRTIEFRSEKGPSFGRTDRNVRAAAGTDADTKAMACSPSSCSAALPDRSDGQKKGLAKKAGKKRSLPFLENRKGKKTGFFFGRFFFVGFFLGAAHFECLKVRGAVARFPYP